jgi:HK97 family phage portal protein
MSIFSGVTDRIYSKIADQLISKKFSLKNPGPLQKWVRDLVGDDETHVTQPYRQSIWVYRCLQQWQAVSQVPVMFKDSDGNDIDSGPLKYLIDHPHPKQTTEDLLKWIILSIGLHGEYFLLREDGTNFDGIPLYLSIVWPSRMTISQGDLSRNDGSVMFWTLNLGGGNTRKIDPRGVIHSASPNPYDCNRGMSPVMAAMASIESDNSARQHNKYQMDRHGRVTGMVTFKDAQGVDNLKLLQKMWAERYEGAENAGRTAFMDGGADFKQLSMAAKDMDWAEGLSITREEICAAYGISTIVAGGLKGATFSNYEMAMKAAWNDTLIPMGRSIAAALNNALIRPIEPDQYIEFDFQNAVAVLQEDENKKIDRYIKLLGGKMTPKQAATLAQIDLGEPNEAHDIIWVSTAEMPASAMLAVPELPADAPKEAQPIQEPPPAPKQFQTSAHMPEDRKALWDAAFKLVHPDMLTHICDHDNLPGKPNEKAQHIHVKQPSEFLQATGRSILKTLFPYERKLDLQLKRFFYDQRKAVLANAHKAIAQVQGKSVETKAKAGDSFANALLGNTDWNAELIKRVKPTLLEVAKLGGKQILKNLGAANRFELVSMDAFMKQQTILLEEVNEYTREALIAGANDILDGVVDGDSLDDTIDKMQDSFKGIFNKTEARRRTIARTETMRAMNGGRMEQMKDIGVEKKQWLAIMDGNVRDSHANLNETIKPLGESWDTIEGNSLEYPGDPTADPGDTINCRCVLIPVFEGNQE